MRKIPSVMATQHPDNAGKPYWNSRAFITTAEEIKECFLCFSDLDINEYNWDWEGKFVDEAVVDRLLHKHFDYFRKYPLGKDNFLTFRIPNPRVEKQFRLARAFMVIVTSSQLAQSLGFTSPPIFETILPLTETAREVIEIQKAYRDLVSLEHRLLKMENSLQYIELIPLFEQVTKIINSGNLLRNYLNIHKKTFGFLPSYIRPYCARSDPALNSGLVPTVLALKVALSSYGKIEREFGVKLYPMLGTGTLPFRGGLSPENIDMSLDEYSGVSTFTIQSAFRYDFKKASVLKAIRKIKEELPKRKAKKLSAKEVQAIKEIIPFFEDPYRRSVECIAPLINRLSMEVAKRRERMIHVGLFGYSRGVGKVRLPRAIPFTAVLYSIGIPPELIGTGRGLKLAGKKRLLPYVLENFRHLKNNLLMSGYFFNRDNLSELAKKKNYWSGIAEDVKNIESVLGIELGPKTDTHREHCNLTRSILSDLHESKEIVQLITRTGILRRSLG